MTTGGQGQLRKPDQERQRRNKPKTAALAVVGNIPIPPAPSGLSERWLERWNGFWGTELAKAAAAVTDIYELERLFTLYEDQDQDKALTEKVRADEFMATEKALRALFQIGNRMAKREMQMLQLEDRLGFNPRSRLAIGLQLTQARRDLDDLI